MTMREAIDDVRRHFLARGMDPDVIGVIQDYWIAYWLECLKSPDEIYRIAMGAEFPRPVSDATGFDIREAK